LRYLSRSGLLGMLLFMRSNRTHIVGSQTSDVQPFRPCSSRWVTPLRRSRHFDDVCPGSCASWPRARTRRATHSAPSLAFGETCRRYVPIHSSAHLCIDASDDQDSLSVPVRSKRTLSRSCTRLERSCKTRNLRSARPAKRTRSSKRDWSPCKVPHSSTKDGVTFETVRNYVWKDLKTLTYEQRPFLCASEWQHSRCDGPGTFRSVPFPFFAMYE
jgi:hypothetical protein